MIRYVFNENPDDMDDDCWSDRANEAIWILKTVVHPQPKDKPKRDT